jgi:glycosyltransferase involved in cell wall biosynthesis
VVGICDATVNNLKSLHSIAPRKLVRVYNGVSPLGPVPAEQRPPKEGFTLLYVGRLEPVKNHTLLLQAFSAARAQAPDLRLWMVGDGTERSRLEALAANLGISPGVTFWGQQLDVAPFFSAADLFIMSSISEGLPISLLQAFSIGLPAIVTDVGGMAEAVRLGQAGVIVTPESADEMAAAILRLAANAAEHQRLSASAASAFLSHFSLQKTVVAYKQLYLSRSGIGKPVNPRAYERLG